MSVSSQPNLKSVGHQEGQEFDYSYKAYSSGKAYSTPQAKDINQDGKIDETEQWISRDFNAWLAGAKRNNLKLTQEEWNELTAYIQTASRNMGVAWNPFQEMGWTPQVISGSSGEGNSDLFGNNSAQPQTNEFGGVKPLVEGSDVDWTYSDSNTDIGFTGDGTSNHSFRYNNRLILKDDTSLKLSYEITAHGQPSVQVLKVIAKSSKGTAVYYYENYQNGIDIYVDPNLLSDPTKIPPIPAELQGKVRVHSIGELSTSATPSAPHVTTPPPNTIETDPNSGFTTRTWSQAGQSVDYWVTQGDEVDNIYNPVAINATNDLSINYTATITLNPNGVKVIDIVDGSGKHVRRIQLMKGQKYSLNGFDKIFYQDASTTPPGPTIQVTSGSPLPDSQLSIGSASGASGASVGRPPNKDHPEDSSPTGINGSTAVYNYPDDEVEIHANKDSSATINTYDISTPKKVTLHANKFNVKFEGPPYRYVIIATFKDSLGNDRTETYYISNPDKGDPLHTKNKIVLDVDDPTKVTGTDMSGIQIGTDQTHAKDMPDNLKKLIQTIPVTDLSKFAAAFSGYPGLDIDYDHDGRVTIDDLKQAFKVGDLPPLLPDTKFIQILVDSDLKMQKLLMQANTSDHIQYSAAMKGVTGRLVELLKILYPSKANTIDIAPLPRQDPPIADADKWQYVNRITFDGQTFSAFDPNNFGKPNNYPYGVSLSWV